MDMPAATDAIDSAVTADDGTISYFSGASDL